MIVVDASVLVDFLIGRPGMAAIGAVLLRGRSLHAPHLLDIEVSQALRRLSLAGLIAVDRAAASMRNLGQLALTRHGHAPLLDRIWHLRHNLTAYDAAYVALAEALDAPLVTRDARLATSGRHNAVIELV